MTIPKNFELCQLKFKNKHKLLQLVQQTKKNLFFAVIPAHLTIVRIAIDTVYSHKLMLNNKTFNSKILVPFDLIEGNINQDLTFEGT